VANFELRHLQDLLDAGLPLPAVNQLEFHPFWHQVYSYIIVAVAHLSLGRVGCAAAEAG
jgi:diketogulonate reductase-like aldo/keto reductase